MKKFFLLVLAVMLGCSLAFPAWALAAGETQPVAAAVYQVEEHEELPQAGLTPDSPFYFIKLLFERLQLLLTFSPEARAERLAEFARRRLAELDALPAEKQARYAERLTWAFVRTMEKAEKHHKRARERRQVAQAVYGQEESVESAVYHTSYVTLRRVYDQVPEQAKPAIEKAMQLTQRGKTRSQAVRDAVYSPGPNTGGGLFKNEDARLKIKEMPPGQAKKQASAPLPVREEDTEEPGEEDKNAPKAPPGRPDKPLPPRRR